MSTTAPPFRRLLLTGAAGTLGRGLRAGLAAHCSTLRVSDIAPLGEAAAHEELHPCALEDRAAVCALLAGVDAVVHFGGVPTEAPFDALLPANIAGVFHLYDAARLEGVRRIVLASSNHVVGAYEQTQTLDVTVPVRPDTLYGATKAWAETLAQLHWDRHGIETVSLRIGSATPEPQNRRMLATWISPGDLLRLVGAALTAPGVGHRIVYGMSASAQPIWDPAPGAAIGYRPRDSSEPWRAALEAADPGPDAATPLRRWHGGDYMVLGPFD
jgi:uronate dehydrogenase